MGIAEKLANANKTNWITEGISDTEVKSIVELAKISAQIERYRVEKGMTQQQFADYMGVSQGMISKWESREYNFTIKTLNEICEKIDLKLTVGLDRTCAKTDYIIVKWDKERSLNNRKKKNSWAAYLSNKEAIA